MIISWNQIANDNLVTYKLGSQPRVGVPSPKSYVDVPAGPRKCDFLYTTLFAQFPTHQYTIFEKAPNFDQIGCFLQ